MRTHIYCAIPGDTQALFEREHQQISMIIDRDRQERMNHT